MDTRELHAKVVIQGNFANDLNRMTPAERAVPDPQGFYFVRAEYDPQGKKTFILLSKTPPEED